MMSVYKRTLLYIIRKRIRSVIIIGIFMVISCFVFIGGMIKNASDNEMQKIRRNLGSSFILKADLDDDSLYEVSDMEGAEEGSSLVFTGPVVTNDIMDQILNIDYVIGNCVNDEYSAWTSLELRPGAWMDNLEDEEYKEHPEYWKDDVVSKEETELYTQKTTLFPCINGELHDFFRIGACKVVKGRNIQKDDIYKAVISKRLAERNHLTVSDLFTIEAKEGLIKLDSDKPFRTVGEPIELEIVGLFETNFEQEYSVYTYENEFIENMIFVDIETKQKLRENYGAGNEKGVSEVTFFVDNPEELNNVMQTVSGLESIKGLILEQDDRAYRASVKPLKQLSQITFVLFIMGMFGCIGLLYLILKLCTRGRKKEVGILRTVGISKREILLQFMMESILLAVIGLILGFMLSGIIKGKMFELAEDMTATKENVQEYKVEIERAGWIPTISKNSSEKVVLDSSVSVKIVVFTIFIVVGSAVISIFLTGKQMFSVEPRELL